MPLLNVEYELSESQTWGISQFILKKKKKKKGEEEEEGSLVIIELNAHLAECMNHLCSTRGSQGPAKIDHLDEQTKKKIYYLTTYI